MKLKSKIYVSVSWQTNANRNTAADKWDRQRSVPIGKSQTQRLLFHRVISLPSAGINVDPWGHLQRIHKFAFQREWRGIANWRQRLKKTFVNSTFYKWEFCLSWHIAYELKYGLLGGSCPSGRSLFIRLLRKCHKPHKNGSKRQCRWLQGSLPSAACPGPHSPAHQPRSPLPCCGERARQQLFFLEVKTPTNTTQTLPCKTVDYSTAVADRRLALIHYMGKKFVPLSTIRFLLICTIEMYRNPEQSVWGLCCTGHFTSTSQESVFEGRSWF